MVGVQVGGVFKNVYAIAAGCMDALGLGDNAKSAFITRALVELQRISAWFGGEPSTVLGLSGLGDLITTCNSTQSRNYQFGSKLATENTALIDEYTSHATVEGIRTLTMFNNHPMQESLELPIMNAVSQMGLQGQSPRLVLKELMNRGLKSEFNG